MTTQQNHSAVFITSRFYRGSDHPDCGRVSQAGGRLQNPSLHIVVRSNLMHFFEKKMKFMPLKVQTASDLKIDGLGDAVEINGIWAEVKKIKFRSTLVQTFDNASLIIPNSEFISSQVTNWSFGDLTLRIKVTVGVAYGSDIERVRSSLLEIAGRTEKVLSNPRPDVLFSDFGDSALIFVLRVWTDVDNMLKVGTAIRFEIDRVFRERNIEIAFPQRDIHIRASVTAKATNEFTVDVQPPEKKGGNERTRPIHGAHTKGVVELNDQSKSKPKNFEEMVAAYQQYVKEDEKLIKYRFPVHDRRVCFGPVAGGNRVHADC